MGIGLYRCLPLFADVAAGKSQTGYPLDSGATFPPYFHVSHGAPIMAIGAVGEESQATTMH